MLNALTIDVEDYFHVTAFEDCISPEQWDNSQLRVVDNTLHLLDLLDEKDVKATFFVLGWVAERRPGLVREIGKRGHEIACHGYGHRRVYLLSRQAFREDIRRSKDLLENITGKVVIGYRAPSYSISRDCFWAFDELFEAGFLYDSSVFPIKHDLYGIPDWPCYPFILSKKRDDEWRPLETPSDASFNDFCKFNEFCFGDQKLLEIPITTLSIVGKNIPIAGGGYFRFFPYGFTKWGLRRINDIDKHPFLFYIHPWEFDPAQPRIYGAGIKSNFRHYINLHKTDDRFQNLLRDFSFATIFKAYGITI